MTRKHKWILITFALFAIVVFACGSEDSSTDIQNEETAAEASSPAITRTNEVFSTESFVDAGWKKSKQYDTATVPESTEIWYGFYQQKDIEIRFYPTHDLAVSAGIPSAEESIEGAVKRSKGGNLLDFSGGSFTGYADYIVAGNAVLLCELERTHCDELLANLE